MLQQALIVVRILPFGKVKGILLWFPLGNEIPERQQIFLHVPSIFPEA